jgi:hypothetical protein
MLKLQAHLKIRSFNILHVSACLCYSQRIYTLPEELSELCEDGKSPPSPSPTLVKDIRLTEWYWETKR